MWCCGYEAGVTCLGAGMSRVRIPVVGHPCTLLEGRLCAPVMNRRSCTCRVSSTWNAASNADMAVPLAGGCRFVLQPLSVLAAWQGLLSCHLIQFWKCRVLAAPMLPSMTIPQCAAAVAV